jgi:EpsI family protein
MIRERLQAAILLVVLLLTGSAAWWLSVRPVALPDVDGLSALPLSLNGWSAVDIEVDQDVADMLRADANVQRAYRHPHGYLIYVYIGYYGTQRGGTPEHTPEICYPAQGWRIVQEGRIPINQTLGLWAREFLVEKEDESRLVHFWYRTRETTGITSTMRLRLRHFWKRITSNRGDGALVRLSARVDDGDLRSARGKLLTLATAVDQALTGVWPEESLQSEEPSAVLSGLSRRPSVVTRSATRAVGGYRD